MGLADFLAQAGNRTAIGQVAQAFGGRTSQQQAMDDFSNQVQAITQELHNNTDETKVRELGGKFLGAAAKAGIPVDHAEKLMEMTIGPALQGIRQEGLNKLFDQYRGQPAIPGESRPQINGAPVEGPLTPQGNFIDPKAATPDKPLDLNFINKFGQLTNAKPEVFNKMLETPGALTTQLMSQRKTQGEIDKEAQAQQQRQNLPNTPLGPGQPSLQDLGTLSPASLGQTLPVREDQGKQEYQNQLLGLKQQGLDNALLLGNQRIAAANDRADRATTGREFNNEAELRREFQTQSKPFQQVRDSYNRIQASGQNPTPAGDLSMVYNYMKMLDPGSVVRESEFASAATAKPMLERLGLSWDAVGSVWSGKKLTTGQRQDFLNRANQLYSTEAQQHGQRVNEISRVAKESGLNPSHVITDMGATGATPAPAGQGGYSGGPSGSGSGSGQGGGAPPVGTISKGYRFKGGNPADRNSWEKVQ